MPLNQYGTYFETACYIMLLFFIVPIKIQDNNVKKQFDNYLQEFNKSYDDATYNQRLIDFERNLKTIELLNKERTDKTAKYGLTKFSDISLEEFKTKYLRHSKINSQILKNQTQNVRKDFPRKVDWRQKNAVSKIKNQNSCGACWAFAIVETIESMNAIKHNKLEELSVQQMIDCSTNNNGCNGGDTCTLLRWLKNENVSVVKETDYPLVYKEKKCKRNASVYGSQISDFVCTNLVGKEDIMLKLLATNGPLTVAINGQTWQNYVGGVIQFHCDSQPLDLNHAVQIVGYDLTHEIPYYILRNSWGHDFGDQGYLYIAVGSNLCGLAYEVSALTVL